jgi:opacity protein-like surface antigen
MKNQLPLLFAAAALSIHSAQAGPKDEKAIIQTTPPPQQGGFYISVFGGADVAQSAESKDINVAGARPIPAGTPTQINSYFAPGNNSGGIAQGANLIPNGTHLTSPTFSTNTDSNVGWFGGLKFGYEFPTPCIIKPSLEFEAFYNGNDTSGSLTSQKSIAGLRTVDNDGDEFMEPRLNPDAIVPSTKANINFKDQMNSAVFMLNSTIKFDLGRIRPYIGGGLGLAYVTHNFAGQTGSGTPVTPHGQLIKTPYGPVQGVASKSTAFALNNVPASYFTFGSDSEETFAWQAIAGVEYMVTPRVSVFTEYKALFYLDGPYGRNTLNNLVGAGVRFNF